MESGHHIISISLGGSANPTGLAVVEPRSEYWYPKGNESELDSENHFGVFWLERVPAGRSYPAIVSRVRELKATQQVSRDCSVLVDITRTGAAPLKLFEAKGIDVEPVEVTDGADATYQNGVHHLPRRDMIGAAQVALQSNRLKVSSGLELAPTLITDLQAFDPALTGRAAETAQIDDLVAAVAVAVWWGERLQWCDEVAESMLPEDDWPDPHDGRNEQTGY